MPVHGGRIVQHGEGHEQAQPGGVDRGRGDLQVAAQLDLAFRLKRIDRCRPRPARWP